MLNKEQKSYTDDLLMKVLKQEPLFSLSDNFADMVAEKAGRRFAWAQYLREFFIYLSVLLGVSLVVAVMSLIWFQNDLKNWLDFLVSNIWIVAGINILIVFVLFTDRVLLRYFLYRSDLKKQFS